MKLKKIIKHKKHLVLGLLLSTLLLTGCVKTTNDPLEVPAKTPSVKQESNQETEEIMPSQSAAGENEFITEAPKRVNIPVNTNREEVAYLCEDGIDLNRAAHRCASDGENVYLAYTESDLYVLPLEEKQHKPAGLVNSEGMKVCNVTTDMEGKVHLLMATPDFEQWFIWQLDDALQVEKEVDITACFNTKQIPLWFMVDKNGDYYLQWMMNRNGAIVSEDGTLLHQTTLDSLGVSWIYEAAVGRDGSIYLLYSFDGESKELGSLDTVKGCLGEDSISLNIPGSDTLSAMAAGTDTEILLFGPYCGVWAYNSEKGTIEQRVKLSEIGYEEGVEYRPLNFLADGRLLTVGGTAEEQILKYIPAGR